MIDGNTYKYGYDAADRLINVKDESNSIIASYTYDSDGNRLTKTVNGVVTTYHYFDGQLLYETLSTDPENTIHALYIRSPQGALEAVSFNYVIGSCDNDYYYYHYNAHGDVIAVTGQSGNVYRQYVYDPYGNIISVKAGSGNAVDINSDSGFEHNYTYKGYRYDKETGLYFLNERYYAAGIGRFLTKDPIIDLVNTQSLNRYAYALGDPVNLKDDGGLYAMPANYSDADPNVQSYSVQREAANQIAFSDWEPLEYKKWQYRYENSNPSTREEDHVHLKGDGKIFQQGISGKRRSHENSPGDPPRKAKQALKDKTGWDWDLNAKPNTNRIAIYVGGAYLLYRTVYCTIRMAPSASPGSWWTIPYDIVLP